MKVQVFLTALAALGFVPVITAHAKAPQGASTEAGTTRSINQWAKCDGTTDDSIAAATAFAAAREGAFTLLVDCPVFIHVGSDIARPIFIDNNTTVRFGTSGLFITDNVAIPTWVIANAHNVTLIGWRVKYVGSMPVASNSDGYTQNGKFISAPGKARASGAFNDLTLRDWYSKNRKVAFGNLSGHTSPVWVGPTNTSAMFFITGSAHDVMIKDMKLYVPQNAGGHQFIPVAFSSTLNYNDGQDVTKETPVDSTTCSVPSDIHVSDLDIDGSYMGWVGGLRDSTFEHVRSHRYGDLQDAAGGTIGGENKWFAPPHLFYLSQDRTKPGLENDHIVIDDVIDYGNRVGLARDSSADNLSGYASSIKIGADNSEVRNYSSDRPDGALDLLSSQNLKITNFQATYDSSFMHDLFPAVRFPSTGYRDITFENMTISDKAQTSRVSPIAGLTQRVDPAINSNIHFKNVTANVNSWGGRDSVGSELGSDNFGLTVEYKQLTPRK